jgi:hypothetical protein
MVTPREIGWVAGFLEGEGTFRYNVSSPLVSAAQAQLEPLERLQKILGGRVHSLKPGKPHHKPQWLWVIGGTNAAGIMMTMFMMMSPRRRQQIVAALAPWRRRGTIAWRGKMTHCKRGHPFTLENIYRPFGGKTVWRGCRICRRDSHRETTRVQRHVQPYCQRGHEMTPHNTQWFGPGKKWRHCAECRKAKRVMQSLRRRVAVTGKIATLPIEA